MEYIQLTNVTYLIDRTISDDSKEQDSFEEQDSAYRSHKPSRDPEKSPGTRFVDSLPKLFVKIEPSGFLFDMKPS